jgi:hypothetical protein
MDMGTARFIKQPGDEKFMEFQDIAADRADPGPIPLKTIGTSKNIHKPIGLAHSGVGGGFYPLAIQKPGGTDRAGPGISWCTFNISRSFPLTDPRMAEPQAVSNGEKKGISKPEQSRPYNNKD